MLHHDINQKVNFFPKDWDLKTVTKRKLEHQSNTTGNNGTDDTGVDKEAWGSSVGLRRKGGGVVSAVGIVGGWDDSDGKGSGNDGLELHY